MFIYLFNVLIIMGSRMAVGEETPYWDTIVFSKIKARFGGRIRVVISGSAPLSPTVQHFLRVYVVIFSGMTALATGCADAFRSMCEQLLGLPRAAGLRSLRDLRCRHRGHARAHRLWSRWRS